jgi:hypothetical protein
MTTLPKCIDSVNPERTTLATGTGSGTDGAAGTVFSFYRR